MTKNSSAIDFFINLGRTQTVLSNYFDRRLGGIGFNEFLILYFIEQSEEQKMRRIDLANKVGLTASGVTRLLLPMEKVHLVRSGEARDDARARLVSVTSAGREKLTEALERLEIIGEEFFLQQKNIEIKKMTEILSKIFGQILLN
ncbi:MAG: MarR family transcriptional regulator [Patescibacteria group bacterium]